jgi:AcrR family transcriptional regulator
MTRQETRTRIVEAAMRSLVDSGYHDTTIKDIASEAGIAVGLAHYYFDNKDDLLVAALELGCPMTDIDLEGMPGLEQAKLGFAAEKQGQISNRETYRLVFGMVGAGMHNPKISEKIRLYLENRRALITGITEAVMSEAPSRPKAGSDAVGAAIWGGFLGIAMQRLLDPDFDGDGALDALAEMATSLASAPRRSSQEDS